VAGLINKNSKDLGASSGHRPEAKSSVHPWLHWSDDRVWETRSQAWISRSHSVFNGSQKKRQSSSVRFLQ